LHIGAESISAFGLVGRKSG